MLALQKAVLEKVRQCNELREALVKTGDRLIVHTFTGDDFYGSGIFIRSMKKLFSLFNISGVPYKYIKDWASGMEKNEATLKVMVN